MFILYSFHATNLKHITNYVKSSLVTIFSLLCTIFFAISKFHNDRHPPQHTYICTSKYTSNSAIDNLIISHNF